MLLHNAGAKPRTDDMTQLNRNEKAPIWDEAVSLRMFPPPNNPPRASQSTLEQFQGGQLTAISLFERYDNVPR